MPELTYEQMKEVLDFKQRCFMVSEKFRTAEKLRKGGRFC